MSLEGQMILKDKYPSIFLRQNGGCCVYYPYNIFATRAVLKIGEYSRESHSFSWGIFGYLTCLDRLRVSENI